MINATELQKNDTFDMVGGALLNIMRHMHQAAFDGNWDLVDSLDQQRIDLLDNIKVSPIHDIVRDQQEILEIVRLDQAVIFMTNQALDEVAAQVSSTTEKSKICQEYQFISKNT